VSYVDCTDLYVRILQPQKEMKHHFLCSDEAHAFKNLSQPTAQTVLTSWLSQSSRKDKTAEDQVKNLDIVNKQR